MGEESFSKETEVVVVVSGSESERSKAEGINSKHVSLAIKAENYQACSSEKIIDEDFAAKSFQDPLFTDKMKRSGRLAILVFVVFFLLIGRYSVPDNEVLHLEDKIMNGLQFANDFINTAGNEVYRNIFQALCSLMVDITFIITFGFWVLKGTSGRLPVTLAIFYVTRALIQNVWFSPFPQGFYWESPGIPSLVVPYGRGSDFFFSGHSGFLVICASEWHKLKFPRVRNFVILAAIYTVLILLIYRIHYTIDIFTGLFFAEWCFGKVDTYKDIIDGYWVSAIKKLRVLTGMKPGNFMFLGTDVASLNQQTEFKAVTKV